jgi:hypothetical protein
MLTKVEPHTTTQKSTATLRETGSKALDAVSAFTDLNQKVVGGLIELSSEAALETVRALAELQSAVVEAVRPAPAAKDEPREPVDRSGWDTFGWYRRGLDFAVDETQRLVKLLEKNGQIMARSGERRQSSGERASKEIRDALEVYAERMRKVLQN